MKINNIPCSCGKAKPAKTKVEFPDGDYFLCGDSECTKSLEVDLIHLNQGRRRSSSEFSEKMIYWSVIGLLAVTSALIIYELIA